MSSLDAAGNEGTPGQGGPAALVGFLYQAKVSVWVALDLILRLRTVDAIELEPAGQEDIAADFRDEETPPVVGAVASTPTKTLVVQVKRRSGDAWTEASLRRLLTHGTHRPSASKQLEDKSVHYVLITSAGVNGTARAHIVKRLSPATHSMPANLLPGHDDPDVSKRISVLADLGDELIDARVQSLLLEVCKVPRDRWQACFHALYDQALARMARPLGRLWTRGELEQVINAHDGYLAASAELELFVKPCNWAELVGRVKTQHAVILHGASGTGKTLAARALEVELRSVCPGLKVTVAREVHEVNMHHPDPVLYLVDDPWGQNNFEAHRAVWSDQLQAMLRAAGANRKFVVTTRDDVLSAAGAASDLKRWLMPIQREQYEQGQWEQMYRIRMLALSPMHQALALDYRADALERLNSPFEMQVFFDELSRLDASDSSTYGRQKIREAISAAHRSSIEARIASQVLQSKAEPEAICLWAIFAAHKNVSFAELGDIVEELCHISGEKYEGVEDLATRFSAGRRLRQVQDVLSYHHPSVEAGLRRVIAANRIAAKRVMADVLRALLSVRGAQSAASWGKLGAARLISAAKRLDSLGFVPPAEASRAVDAWLEQNLLAPVDFESALLLTAEAGSEASVAAEVARLLIDRITYNAFGVTRPRPVELSKEEAARMKGSSLTKEMVRRYIVDVLPYQMSYFRPRLAELFTRIAGDTDEAYVSAAEVSLRLGRLSAPTDQIFPSALKIPASADALTVIALNASESLAGPSREDCEKVENGWYDDSHEAYMFDGYAEEWQVVDQWISMYVDHVRSGEGWRCLASKPFGPRLASWWMQALCRDGRNQRTPLDEDEFGHLLGCAFTMDALEVNFWEMASVAWSEQAADRLVWRLVEGSANSDCAKAAVACLMDGASHLYDRIEGSLLQRGDYSRLFELLLEIGDFVDAHRAHSATFGDCLHSDEELQKMEASEQLGQSWLDMWISRQSPALREVILAGTRRVASTAPLSDPARAMLKGLKPKSEAAVLRKLELSSAEGIVDERELSDFVESASSGTLAEKGVSLAVENDCWKVVEAALAHRFEKAQAAAISALAARSPASLTSEVLALRNSHSKYVKAALLDAIKANPLPSLFDCLLEMTSDTWLGDDPSNDTCYPFARRAAEHLGLYGPLTPEHETALLARAAATDDWELREEFFRRVMAQGTDAGRSALLVLMREGKSPAVARAASMACLENIDCFTAQQVEAISTTAIRKSSSSVASALVILVGRHGSDQAVEQLALELSQQSSRRVFLLLLLLAMQGRDELSDRIQTLLPPKHPGLNLLAESAEPLPRTALDDLGSVANVRVVVKLLNASFEEKPVQAPSWLRADEPIDEGYEEATP